MAVTTSLVTGANSTYTLLLSIAAATTSRYGAGALEAPVLGDQPTSGGSIPEETAFNSPTASESTGAAASRRVSQVQVALVL